MDPHLFPSGRSLGPQKGPASRPTWNWGVFHEVEDNGGVRGRVGLLVWAEQSMLSLPE